MAALGSGRRDKCPLAEICGVSLRMVRAKCPMRTPSRLSSFFLFGPGRLRWLSASVVTSTDSPQRPPTTICLGPRMPHTVACPAGDPNPRAHPRIYLSIRIHLPGEIHSFFFFFFRRYVVCSDRSSHKRYSLRRGGNLHTRTSPTVHTQTP